MTINHVRPFGRLLSTFAFTLVFTLILALLAAPPAQAGGSTGAITGTVADLSTSAPLAGAQVVAAGKSALTDSTGRYTLSGVAVGTQTVTASASAYQSASVTVSVVRRQTVTAPTLFLAQNWGAVAGTVTNGATRAAIAGAVVSIAGTSLSATTDSGGAYSIAKVPAGAQTVTASASGYQAASQAVSVPGGGSVSCSFALTAAVISGPGSTIAWNGGNFYLLGANYAWYNYGTDFGTGGWGKYTDWTAVATDFAAMHAQGVSVARWWVFADGRYAPDFNSDGTVSGLDSSVLADVDRAVQIAASYHICLLLTVMDGSMWGPASTSGSVQMGGHSALITSAAAQQTFLDNALKPLLQHIAASSYKSSVLGYDLVNEPEAQMSGYWGGSNLAASAVQAFVQKCADYVHTYGGGGYATVGSATPYYVATWKGLGLDFYQVHYYPWMDFSNGAGSGLPTYASLGLDKPCIVGEFPTNTGSYGLSDTNALSSKWYLDSIYKNGYAGALAWSYRVGDSASNWSLFQPVFSDWAQTYSAYTGPK